MSSSSLAKFRRRLALVDYFRDLFGVGDVTDRDSVRSYYDQLNEVNEGYDSDGRSYVYNFVRSKADEERLPAEDLIRYDDNLRQHTDSINERRSNPITFKPFQLLAGLMSEAYLDRVLGEPDDFLDELNDFVDTYNDEHKSHIKYPEFTEEDLKTAAFWMATGSGKTLLMHLNYYQYLHYADKHDETPDNVLLVTTNEDLSSQHIEELRESSIPCRSFNADSVDLWSVGDNPVKVIEIQKLTEDKTGEGLSVEVDSFEGNNLVMVDEGHKGADSDAQTWRNRRQKLASDGFTFEYSATFGQAVAGSGTDIEEEYGKNILFDYSYPRFYDDGYGKDYQVLNLENDVNEALRDRYLLANLLGFFEQVYVYEDDEETYRGTYNIRYPLLVFIGHSVNADKTRSSLGKNDERSLSDVQDILMFLDRVLQNEDDWVPEAIELILNGESGLEVEDGGDLFYDSFGPLMEFGLSGEEIYQRMLSDVFNVDSTSTLCVTDISNAQGEIGLRAHSSDRYFGVINIGNDRVFLDRMEDHDIEIEEDEFSESLFHEIDDQDSDIKLLLGSRKFIEGWDSWRVSTMGLMNFGRREGPQVIQLFGRGVRLLGKDRTLKRSREIPGDHPDNIESLETLSIFGVRADYMSQFRDYLSEEGIDMEPKDSITIETETQEHFKDQGLLVVEPQTNRSFKNSETVSLESTDKVDIELNLSPQLGIVASDREYGEAKEADTQTIPEEAVGFMDWDEIYRDIWRFRSKRGYDNQTVEKSVLKKIIEDGHYTLRCKEELVKFQSFDDLKRIREVVLMILRKYIEQHYRQTEKVWEQSNLVYKEVDEEIDDEEGVIIDSYTAEVTASAEDVIDELEETKETDLYTSENGLPSRIHYDRHLYLPLLFEEDSYSEEIDYSPPGLNDGEQKLVRDLIAYFRYGQGKSIPEDWEVYFLRNQTRKRGIGFLMSEKGAKRFYPDFILWLKNDEQQHVVFLDPHGLGRVGNPFESPKVNFHKKIKDYQKELSDRTGRENVSLHSYIISVTEYDTLEDLTGAEDRSEFHERGIYFQDDSLDKILGRVID